MITLLCVIYLLGLFPAYKKFYVLENNLILDKYDPPCNRVIILATFLWPLVVITYIILSFLEVKQN